MPAEPGPSTEPAPRVRRVVLLVHDSIRSAVNRFGVRRLYRRKPHVVPAVSSSLDSRFEPANAQVAAAASRKRTLAEIIYPFPNLTSFLYRYHFWILSNGKTTERNITDLQSTLLRPDFIAADLQGVNFPALDKKIVSGEGMAPWNVKRDGWKETPITIGIPNGEKSTNATRRDEATEHARQMRAEPSTDPSEKAPVGGIPYTLTFHHKSLLHQLVDIARTVPDLVWDPHLLEFLDPTDSSSLPEPIYHDVFNSPSMVDADVRLQHSPREKDCNLPRAIMGCMFHSDAMLVAQFGTLKVWPGYLFSPNQSKYVRGAPTANAAHAVVYFPSLPDSIQDYIRERYKGKAPMKTLLTHLRREIFHACWEVMLDDEFVEAYFHGVIVECSDGVTRRLYPRIFSYSADYPEKVLMSTIRDQGGCPCPRCLIKFSEIPNLGTAHDAIIRKDRMRHDDSERRCAVKEARTLIYEQGYVVNSAKVEELLKPMSLVPTSNAFSARLAADVHFDFHKLVVTDQMHEGDIGIVKAVLLHLVRILEAHDSELVKELNARFRQILPFSGIRRFTNDVSEFRSMGARDYEDILQCSIPCFEGLLPEPHNTSILTLLFTIGYWHGCSKMRLHIERSACLFDSTSMAVGVRLRHFTFVTCPQFATVESDREYRARMTAASKRSVSSSANPPASTNPSASSDPSTSTNPGPAPATHIPAASTPVTASGGRRPRTFNMKTIKTHLVGYWPADVRRLGTLEAYSTWSGELAHRAVKARYARTNYRDAEGQIVKIDILQTRLRLMAQELRELGVDIPGEVSNKHHDVAMDHGVAAAQHHRIAREQHKRNTLTLREWLREQTAVPDASDYFVAKLKEYTLRFREDASFPPPAVRIQDGRIYSHGTARINFTTYDLRRDQDIIHPSQGRYGILISAPGADGPHPWVYAWVLGVFHTNVIWPDRSEPERVEFLWVRWMEVIPSDKPYGPETSRLERLRFADTPTGFVDPADVIRGAHFIPAFHYGPANPALTAVTKQTNVDGWNSYYMNRLVDRDMLVRFMGLGVGHLPPLKAYHPETFPVPEESVYDNHHIPPSPLESNMHNGSVQQDGEGLDENSDFVEDDEEEELRLFEQDLTEEGFPDLLELLAGL